MDSLCAELSVEAETSNNTDDFLNAIRKYTRARKLTPHMLHELVDRIEVFHAEKVDSVKQQKLRIHYSCVGSIEIPDLPKISHLDVEMETRQGVKVGYTSDPVENEVA